MCVNIVHRILYMNKCIKYISHTFGECILKCEYQSVWVFLLINAYVSVYV